MAKMASVPSRSSVRFKSVVRGYHVYKEDWRPEIGDEFIEKVDKGNRFDRYAVAVIVNDIALLDISHEKFRRLFITS